MTALTPEQIKQMHSLPVRELIQFWDEMEDVGRKEGRLPQVVRMLVLADLYYMLVRVCGRKDLLPCVSRPGFVDNQFAFDRCREVQANPDGYIDLWAREHNKTSIITFGLTLHDVLTDPEVTFGIFSFNRPIAKAFLRLIMREVESNKTLQAAFPDILCSDVREYPNFSEDDGWICKRKSNPNEATTEAWGIVDSMPVSKHFRKLLYDDLVVLGSVGTPEMIQKTLTALELSYNLGTVGGAKRMLGTRWNFADAYRTVVDRGTFKSREYPGRKGGTEEGESIYWSDETHRQKRQEQGPYAYASQILLNPKADALQGFKREWLRYYKRINPRGMNGYILVDSANAKRKDSDYTSMWVIGLGADGNYYALDLVRDRLNLTERVDRLFDLRRTWISLGLKIQQVRWERYGMMADIEAVKREQENRNYRFDITEVGGQTAKDDRIKRLLPIFEQGKFYLMESKHVTDWEKTTRNLVHDFIEQEFYPFPNSMHKDMMDSLSRIAEPDLTLSWPKEEKSKPPPPPRALPNASVAWMA